MNFQNLKTSLVIFCNIISFNILIAQNNEQFRVDNILKKYGAETKKINDIEFLIIKTDNTPKPTVLFITGSGFLPFFVNGRMGAFPFNVKEFKDKYNFVIISKPGIPLFVDSISNKHINFTLSEGYYLDTLGQIPKKFTENNNLKYYTKSHNVVINYLSKQSWVENDKLFLIGHSQGAHAATHIALNNKRVKKVVILSPGSIFNRFHESIRKIRYDEAFGLISIQNAQLAIDSIQNRFKMLQNNKSDNKQLFDGNTYYSYNSFTFPSIKDEIVLLKQNTLLIYGTSSNQDLDCDYLKLDLIEKKNNKVIIMPKIGYDHNFFKNEFNEKGEKTRKSFNWNIIMNEILVWLKE